LTLDSFGIHRFRSFYFFLALQARSPIADQHRHPQNRTQPFMAENSNLVDDATAIEIELGSGDEGDEASTYRTQNDPSQPYQRSNVIERKGSVSIHCVAVDVVHGTLEPEGELATLLVFDFQFDPNKRARRIVEAKMSFVFASTGGDPAPAVLKIAPRGRMTVVPTPQTESTTRGAKAEAGGGALGISLGAGLTWEKSVSRETSDATTVVGSIDLVGRNYGASNGVSWALIENRSVETGVPAHVRTAVLLQRAAPASSSSAFQATVTIRAQADLRSSVSRLFGKTPKDDPILYDPSLPPTHKLQHYELDQLGKVDLQALSAIAFTNDGASG
jgi:hypothetical protein